MQIIAGRSSVFQYASAQDAYGRTVFALADLWLRRLRTRRALRELDARSLVDVGLTERQRQAECAKWPWQG